MNKRIDMSAFVGVDFDCEFFKELAMSLIDQWITSPLKKIRTVEAYKQSIDLFDGEGEISSIRCRPRIGKAQVLEDYTPILVEGFVWEVTCQGNNLEVDTLVSYDFREMISLNHYPIHSAAFKGIQQGYGLSEWAKANDVPIFNSDMEVV